MVEIYQLDIVYFRDLVFISRAHEHEGYVKRVQRGGGTVMRCQSQIGSCQKIKPSPSGLGIIGACPCSLHNGTISIPRSAASHDLRNRRFIPEQSGLGADDRQHVRQLALPGGLIRP
jgi:hypothetical protein